jgi:Domain of unknown function (DUF4082)
MIKSYTITGLVCLCYFIQPMRAQSSLFLSPASALSGAPGSLALSLSAPAGSAPAALEWTLAYPSGVTGFAVAPGPALGAAGKTLSCVGGASAYTCLASGLNSNAIGNGSVASVSFNAPAAPSISVSIPNAVGVSATGSSIAISSTGAIFTEIGVSALQCVAAANGDTCTVTLSGTAPTGGALVGISSGNPALSVPASVIISSGATSVSFAATIAPVAIAQNAQVTASLGSSAATTTVQLSPPSSSAALFQLQGKATEVSGVTNGSSVTPESSPAGLVGSVVVNGAGSVNFVSGQTGSGVYFLNCCANTNQAYYKFTGAAIGNIFKTTQGKISFTLESRYSFAQRQASAATPRYAFDVRDGNGTHLFYFVTQVSGPTLYFMYEAAGSAQYYWAPQGTEDALFGKGVTLNVSLEWSSSGLNLYLNGALVRSTPFSPLVANWTNASNFDLGAYEYLSYGGFYASDDVIGDFTVTTGGAPAAALSIWSSTAVPATPWLSSAVGITVGVKFRSDAAGMITGIRFYKGAGNNGTHVGMLYDRSGNLLAQATFSGETESGWQQMIFPGSVAIAPNTTYVAALFSPSGFAYGSNYFTSSGVDNPPLHALQSGVDGGNGVYTYGVAAQFPNQTYFDGNYWVDVVFSAQ